MLAISVNSVSIQSLLSKPFKASFHTRLFHCILMGFEKDSKTRSSDIVYIQACLFPSKWVANKKCDWEAENFFFAIFKRSSSCFNLSLTLKNNWFLRIIFTTEGWLIFYDIIL